MARARTKAQRKKERLERGEATDLSTNLSTGLSAGLADVPMIPKRDRNGKRMGTSRREMKAKAPELRHRKMLFTDGQKGKAWDPKAGFPIGVYLLRGELSQEQFDAGQNYAMAYVFAARVNKVPHRFPRSISLDHTLKNTRAPDWEPSAQDMRRASNFMKMDIELRGLEPGLHRVLQLALMDEVMGRRAERSGAGETREEYRVEDLAEALDLLIKRRIH